MSWKSGLDLLDKLWDGYISFNFSRTRPETWRTAVEFVDLFQSEDCDIVGSSRFDILHAAEHYIKKLEEDKTYWDKWHEEIKEMDGDPEDWECHSCNLIKKYHETNYSG